MQKTRRRTPKGLAASALRARPSSFRKTRFHLVESMGTRVKSPERLLSVLAGFCSSTFGTHRVITRQKEGSGQRACCGLMDGHADVEAPDKHALARARATAERVISELAGVDPQYTLELGDWLASLPDPPGDATMPVKPQKVRSNLSEEVRSRRRTARDAVMPLWSQMHAVDC